MSASSRAFPVGDGVARVEPIRKSRRVPPTSRAGLSSRGFRGSGAVLLPRVPSNGAKQFAMAGWVDNRAEVTVPVSLPVVWELWQDKSRIPNWMPWIDSVVPDENDPMCSRWILRTNQFGQDFEFSWVARDLPPVQREKIQWESTEGLNNKGKVTFKGVGENGKSTNVAINISYEVPELLVPFGAAVSPLVENILKADLIRFSEFAGKVVQALGKRRKAAK